MEVAFEKPNVSVAGFVGHNFQTSACNPVAVAKSQVGSLPYDVVRLGQSGDPALLLSLLVLRLIAPPFVSFGPPTCLLILCVESPLVSRIPASVLQHLVRFPSFVAPLGLPYLGDVLLCRPLDFVLSFANPLLLRG